METDDKIMEEYIECPPYFNSYIMDVTIIKAFTYSYSSGIVIRLEPVNPHFYDFAISRKSDPVEFDEVVDYICRLVEAYNI